MKVLYTAKASSTGGRTGDGATDDGVLDVMLTEPREKGGPGAPGTHPEQLFAVGYSAGVLGAVKAAAEDLVQRAHVIGPYSEASRKGFEVSIGVV
ncbi:hypothetical protein [Devosia nitrariae]|uniref:Uncharacterized protein n=1 Tax=Devosia nitrariae TaxID=2071872 RepID=A0ABQ5VZF9_9HYPH|nr:hypothetical protein [Devosia nitrariae]GLQ53210.1 hypothetical protein GCM10010862_04680 [Devosia nitrariae]